MQRLLTAGFAGSLLFAVCTTPAAAQADSPNPQTSAEAPSPPKTFAEALRRGQTKVSLRYRFETVSEDALAKDAYASTLRTTLSYGTAPFRGFTLFAEAENVAALFDDDSYRNAGSGGLSNGVTGRPVVADPALTDVNQVYLRYQRGKARGTLGRQEINLGDQRFVGAVGWRQHHQSFDALRLELHPSARVGIDYTFVDKVHRIFGDTRPLTGHLLNLPISVAKDQRLTLYGYYLDWREPVDARRSTGTIGAELIGSRDLGAGAKLRWELEYAQQRDVADNPDSVDTSYLNARLGIERSGFSAFLAWEVLEGGSGGAFQTPLATLHKWNGWADKFLNTPPAGLETLYVELGGPLGPTRWTVVFLDFQAEAVSIDYGSEIDAELSWKAPWSQTFALKLALYDADAFSTDTDKVILHSGYSF